MRLVVKIGTSTLVDTEGRLEPASVQQLGEQIRTLWQAGHEVVVVSSGAVGTGSGAMRTRPQDIVDKQALAAIGQPLLMQAYQAVLAPYSIAQILLIRDDLEKQQRREQAGCTLERLLAWRVIPVINENDTVANEEIRVGDNDTLAAQVAVLLEADLLILLSDIDGIYDHDPRESPAQLLHRIEDLRVLDALPESSLKGDWGTGGIATKVAAAKTCYQAGVSTVIANGRHPAVLPALVRGEALGTHIQAPERQRLGASRK